MDRLHATNGNGNGTGTLPPDLVPYVPVWLQDRISEIFETEGMMQESAERQILTLLASNQKETQSSITANHRELQGSVSLLKDHVNEEMADLKADITDKMHEQELIANGTNIRVKALETAEEVAAGERRDTKRLTKGALIGSVLSIFVGIAMSVYGPAARVAPIIQQEAKQDTALNTKIDKFLEKQDKFLDVLLREHTEQESPSVPARSRGRGQGRGSSRMPEPVLGPGPGAKLVPDGAMITTRESLRLPIISSNISPPEMMRIP